IKQVSFLQDATIVIDGFHRFTPLEQSIVSELLHVARKVQIALILPQEELDNPLDELDLFYQTKETYKALTQRAKDEGVEIDDSIYLHKKDEKVQPLLQDRKSTRLNSSHVSISYAVFCWKRKTRTRSRGGVAEEEWGQPAACNTRRARRGEDKPA